MKTPFQLLDLASSYIRPTDASGGTLALLVTDPRAQTFNISVAKTVTLPSTGIITGQTWTIENQGSAILTLQSSAAGSIASIVGNSAIVEALQDTPTLAAHWRLIGYFYKPGFAPGITSGSNIGSGYIGQVVNPSISGGNAINASWVTWGNFTNLPAGLWLLGGSSNGSGTATDVMSTGFSLNSTGAPTMNANTNTLGPQVEAVLPTQIINLSAPTTIYLMGYRVSGSNANWGNGTASKTFALRIG